MHLAIACKSPEIVKLLVSLGADTNLIDNTSKRPIDYLPKKKDSNTRMIMRLVNRRKDSDIHDLLSADKI